MFSGQVIRKCLVPAAVIVEAKVKSQNDDNICRASDLPIYTPEPEEKNVYPESESEAAGALENAFRTARLTLTKYSDDFKAYKRVGIENLEKGKESVEWFLAYLQKEDNTTPKAGAIGIGAITGLIFGLRGGMFKRTLYASTGALGMAAVCYPKQATEYSQAGLVEARKYLTIAYNFIYGVKKDDPPLELPSLPKFPTTISETWNSIKSTATSFVSDKPEKVAESVQEQVTDTPESTPQVKDPHDVITESHSNALSKSCHCPIGACLGHSDENPTPSQPAVAS